jgi:hypothetical protein
LTLHRARRAATHASRAGVSAHAWPFIRSAGDASGSGRMPFNRAPRALRAFARSIGGLQIEPIFRGTDRTPYRTTMPVPPLRLRQWHARTRPERRRARQETLRDGLEPVCSASRCSLLRGSP